MRDDRLFMRSEYVSACTNVDSNKTDEFRGRKEIKKEVVPNLAFIESLKKYEKKESYRDVRLRKLKEYGMLK